MTLSMLPRTRLRGRRVLSLAVISRREMKKLNLQFRKRDYPTDVLSFEGSCSYLGEIVICESIARINATKDKIPLVIELQALAVHGLLHLVGYEHEKRKAQARTMFRLQKAILEKLHRS